MWLYIKKSKNRLIFYDLRSDKKKHSEWAAIKFFHRLNRIFCGYLFLLTVQVSLLFFFQNQQHVFLIFSVVVIV